MSPVSDYFDVLSINDENGNVDIIQSLLGNDCLGTYFENGDAQLYFNGGKRDEIELCLQNINADFHFQWKWEKQNKEDWHLAWKDDFQPVVIDEKLAVIPHWQNEISADIVIKIKPGMAFGTGHHETTWLMLNQILKQVKPGMSVLDLGAGSGILSITANKLGAEKVDAVEFDSDCESNFNENLQLNNLDGIIPFHNHDV
ncbi:MAG: 50S ribosomal protein L11 methyltransferase, partial [Candidatus Marinimicrobia bacterium]|nr:50S ribosomal protein L11 methyltransferase [Candidatus Neomarinimicrobiota bacterium]